MRVVFPYDILVSRMSVLSVIMGEAAVGWAGVVVLELGSG